MVRMACQNALASSPLLPSPCKAYRSPPPLWLPSLPHPFPSSPSSSSSSRVCSRCRLSSTPSLPARHHHSLPLKPSTPRFPPYLSSSTQFICKTAEYVFPDPIPEFAEAETNKFRTYLLQRLSKTDYCGDSVEEVVRVCTEILSNFLHTEYGGPGTLLVVPFIDMADTVNESGLPGGPQAARAAVVWAQKNVDKDWKEWTGGDSDDSK